ncbi:hypothetical protein K470DRAFT_264247 [Piedraia hortae CBS 480.64]|uniref:Uncharacterized protein n=1 Tax=Piedraia hortae CBS 480.64 TaxID=1314780 RepID=A0A6A7BZS3_9PEZI|nr:hypothetical protein K470DRAFT_264247 [Piedraia hortae CBS 480.64]
MGTNRAKILGKIMGQLESIAESLGGEGNVVDSGHAHNALGLCRAMMQHEENTVNTNGAVQDKLNIIIKRLDKLENGAPVTSPIAGQVMAGKPLWSQVADKSKGTSTVEVRLDNREGAEKTAEETLKIIKQSIPDAKAIIPDPRAEGKVTVVVGSTMRRDQILATGFPATEAAVIIRRLKFVMVMGFGWIRASLGKITSKERRPRA